MLTTFRHWLYRRYRHGNLRRSQRRNSRHHDDLYVRYKVYDAEKQGNWCMTKKYTHLARIYIADMAYMHDNRCLYIITADMIVLTNFVECNLF